MKKLKQPFGKITFGFFDLLQGPLLMEARQGKALRSCAAETRRAVASDIALAFAGGRRGKIEHKGTATT
jgi:hypothetical protein